jgi:hypothetical protein
LSDPSRSIEGAGSEVFAGASGWAFNGFVSPFGGSDG